MFKKATKLFKALSLIIRQPALLNHVLNDNAVWQKYVGKNHKKEQGLPVVELDTLFPGFEAHVPVLAFLDGSSLPTDMALLVKLAENIEDCTYFEIGTWRGESVTNVATVAGECFTLNLEDDAMRQMGLPEAYVELTGFFSNNKKNITQLRGNSFDYDFGALNKKFDLIFIDGDHHYESVKNDTEKVFRHLVHENSIVVWHDYARNPETIRYDVLAGILDGLPKHLQPNLYHVGNTLSAICINKKFAAHVLSSPVKPEHYFLVEIKQKAVVKGI